MITSFDIEGSEEFKEAVRDFIEFRKEKKKPLTARGFELFIRKLDKLADDEETKIKIIEQSIENSWTGVFPLHFDAETPHQSPCGDSFPSRGSLRRANVKPSGFNNFTQVQTDFETIRRKKREQLIQEVGRCNDN